MKKSLLVWAVIALMIVAGPVLAQEDLDETFVAEDGTFGFNYPSAWELEVDEEGGAAIVYNDEMTVFVYTPATVESWNWDSDDPAEVVQAVLDQWVEDGLEVGNIKEADFNGRSGAYANYSDEGTPGMVLFVVLSDGALGAIDTVGVEGDKDIADRATVLAIAETYDVVFGGAPAGVSLKDYDDSYQDVIAELRSLDLIEAGGSLLFQEDYAWFEGQGSFYTPLARNSPYTNFVMSGELTYHSSDPVDLETCTLGARVVWTGGTTTSYVDIGYASGYGVFFLNMVDGESESDGVSALEVDIDDPHVFTIIAVDDTMTVFVDGELAFDRVDVSRRSGTWGIGLTGQGANAKCEGRDIWVYTLP